MNKPLGLWNAVILLCLPCLLLVAFTHYPVVQSVLGSFWNNSTAIRPSRFVGLDNYEQLLADDRLARVLWNSFLYALVTIPVTIALSISMALLVDSKLPGRAFMRLSFFLPPMLPMIAVATSSATAPSQMGIAARYQTITGVIAAIVATPRPRRSATTCCRKRGGMRSARASGAVLL